MAYQMSNDDRLLREGMGTIKAMSRSIASTIGLGLRGCAATVSSGAFETLYGTKWMGCLVGVRLVHGNQERRVTLAWSSHATGWPATFFWYKMGAQTPEVV